MLMLLLMLASNFITHDRLDLGQIFKKHLWPLWFLWIFRKILENLRSFCEFLQVFATPLIFINVSKKFRNFLDNLVLLFFLVDFSWETCSRVFPSGGLSTKVLVMLDCWNLVLLFLLVDFSFRWTVSIVVMVETTLSRWPSVGTCFSLWWTFPLFQSWEGLLVVAFLQVV